MGGIQFVTPDALFEQSQMLFKGAQDIASVAGVSAEDLERSAKMFEDGKKKRAHSKMLASLQQLQAEAMPDAVAQRPAGSFKSLGAMLTAIHGMTFESKYDPRLQKAGGDIAPHDGKQGWATESKDLVENIGASGGFLVFPEHLTQLFQMDPLERIVRMRSTVLPMRARTMQVPVLDQTGAPAAGRSSYYGGVAARWTEEGTAKEESEPSFRQMQLTAHELVLYTEASDALLADSAIPLEALLQNIFSGAILNEEEWTFVNGTGAGQPLGIVTANTSAGTGPTIVVPRLTAGAIGIDDVFEMVSAFQGRSPIWIAHQSAMPDILSLNGPVGNPNYVWIGNGRDQQPTTLMGWPIFFVENAQPLGTMGDLTLADLSKYLIGDRQMVTMDASKHFRFQYNLTSWRAVHRVDGRPWLSAPITYRDGVTTVSPFVVLGDAEAS